MYEGKCKSWITDGFTAEQCYTREFVQRLTRTGLVLSEAVPSDEDGKTDDEPQGHIETMWYELALLLAK
jgi:hypothetical protein